jgi:uncharacterized membrane protein
MSEQFTEGERESRLAIAGHPIHAMLVTFPIALITSLLPSDLAWVLTQDAFWARASLWLAGTGAIMGLFAAIIGTLELLLIPAVRRHGMGWSHFVAAMVLIAVAFSNWYLRLEAGAEEWILPWGLALSVLGAGLVMVAGWLGANLIFDHRIAITDEE